MVAGTLFSDGFETGLGSWTRLDSPTWGTTTYRAATGTTSAYCVGSSLPAPSVYPRNLDSFMYAGPFNLSGLNTGALEFDMWLDSETAYDSVACLVSTDGLSFMGEMYSGYSAGWIHVAMDLRSVGGYHTNVTQSPSVWIGFEFYSDDINLGVDYEGAYIDNVALSAALVTPVISSVSPSDVSAGTQSTITIHGTGFGAVQGDQGSVKAETEKGFDLTAPVVSWSDTAIVAIVPATTNLSDGPVVGKVTVRNNLGRSAYTQQTAFHVSFAYGGARWAGTSATYRINPNTADTPDAVAMIDAAAATWNAASSFQLINGGACGTTSLATDGYNDIFFYNRGSVADLFRVAAQHIRLRHHRVRLLHQRLLPLGRQDLGRLFHERSRDRSPSRVRALHRARRDGHL